MDLIKANIRKYIYFVALSIVTAGGNMCIIYIINNVLKSYLTDAPLPSVNYMLLFAAALSLSFVGRWLVSRNIIGFTQEVLHRLRHDILQMILKSAYYPLVKNKERIYSAMTRDVGNIVQSSVSFVDVVTNFIIVVICFVYMALISWKLLLCTVALLMFTIFIYAYSEKKGHALFSKAMKHDDRFGRYLNEILDGFKEIVIERKKGTAIEQKHMVGALDASAALNKKALVTFLNNRVIGQMAFYAFIGALLLYLGKAFSIPNDVLVNFIFLVLYVFGPIETVVILIPGFSQAKTSLKRLASLKNDLWETDAGTVDTHAPVTFEKLELKQVFYQYQGEHGGERPFSVGALDFSLEAGKIVFICGNNGSGKTTFINLLVGLFAADKGTFYVNDVKVEDARSYSYRALFAPVFSDFHLFDECYSVENVAQDKVDGYIKMFELEDKVSFDGTRFTTIDLSTGQRKRLALICAMLEKKPILILDEFGADQDPYFRKKFYTVILQFLKQEGFTIVAITHDDHYYSCCDYIYKFQEGEIELMKVYGTAKTMA
ncbi:cyclic peptide export ABC transporter [Chitinophaga japonensis]|uniref:Putative ATP-binding cassette transporter n=1 Tax=Chitinophaga japonensis TaxID=104662 RepID=A0A562SV37_CHIJA|nr:cyclic peptide export ABC transporter [Chitinophaga japonensis]TWI84566.1 putative ATP-binding cassette transporter [Chitinophaga japonensis]